MRTSFEHVPLSGRPDITLHVLGIIRDGRFTDDDLAAILGADIPSTPEETLDWNIELTLCEPRTGEYPPINRAYWKSLRDVAAPFEDLKMLKLIYAGGPIDFNGSWFPFHGLKSLRNKN